MKLVARNTALLIFFVISLTGCAREPNLRSIVFREFGANAVLLDPIATASRKRSFLPGSLTLVDVEQPKDVFRGLAERWNVVQEGTNLCQQQKKRLQDTLVQRRPDVIEDFIFDETIGIPRDRQLLRASYSDLDENEIGRIGRVTFKLTNIASYSLDEPALRDAFREIQQSKCMMDLRGRARIAQVSRIYIADLDIKVERASGAKLGIGSTRAWIQSSNGFMRRTKKGLLAIIPD